ncbi:MAG TPA: M23 family metallopeptidase [Candidatus Moranbacteria bacterium]|nr:M23 family metallopeptidase [Candidatus Moranbacteria bacterium]
MKRYITTIVLLIIFTIIIIAVSRFYFSKNKTNDNAIPLQNNNANLNNQTSHDPLNSAILNIPLDKALSRITKKPFGIYVSPGNSPVTPEKFTGYHTGTDFETTPEEADIPVEIHAITDGKIINKLSISGYGGVILEKAVINNQPVIILYGHVDIRAENSRINIGDTIKKGDSIAILSPGYSPQSGGERKHLHLGIIKGSTVDYRGYAQNQNELSRWIDAESILGK